jgi:hypothetical protein
VTPEHDVREDPLRPSVSLLAKLGSIVAHASELGGPDGHAFDLVALRALLDDKEVIEWIGAMESLALLPIRRAAP